jgi:hypothetical protein
LDESWVVLFVFVVAAESVLSFFLCDGRPVPIGGSMFEGLGELRGVGNP